MRLPETTIDLELPGEPRNTLVIRLRVRSDGKPTYQARRFIPMELRRNPRYPYKTTSLKTDNLETAKALAHKWERSIFVSIDRKEPLDKITFRSIAKSYIDWATKRVGHLDRDGIPLANPNAVKREETCLRRYLIPYFGDRDIRSITVTDIEQYIDWRRDYYVDGPGAHETEIRFRRGGKTYVRPSAQNPRPARSTINKDAVAYGKVLHHARRLHKISVEEIPRIRRKQGRLEETSRRPRFDDAEWDLLVRTAAHRWINTRNNYTRHFQHVLWGLIEFLYGTGIRISEAMWLQRKHLSVVPVTDRAQMAWDQIPPFSMVAEFPAERTTYFEMTDGRLNEFRIKVAHDNPGLKQADHARSVIPISSFSENFAVYLNLLSVNVGLREERMLADFMDLPPDFFLFPGLDGERIQSFRGGFESLLNAAVSPEFPDGLKLKDGKNRTLTSIRHTYASKQIETGATRVSVGFLADNMGTSTEMIRKHYGQALRELRAEDLQNY